MTCASIRRRLLGVERPDQPPPELREHLAGCAECREWQQRLIETERGIGRLEVPPSEGKAAFVLQFLAGDRVSREVPLAQRLKEGGRLKVALSVGLAAGLAICALGMWAWTNRTPDRADKPALARKTMPDREGQLQRKRAKARTDGERAQRMVELAEEVLGEARMNSADAERMDEVARFFVAVVRVHLMDDARKIPKAERAELGALAKRLLIAQSEASHLEVELKALPHLAASAASFHDIAQAALETSVKLEALARGEPA
jgi:hypothetical protein